ncbi:(2Fe-2S)-binding protein [Archangium lansingense]|uniref:Bacterioferritin-associated ferredoxin n=1 Tax=Archangium lansingense TaxID=2995310 RepID=A0ABT4ANH5_9BACT|nr:(2Fe-2S)-binding protein [Archangium lansinium]
MIVCLCHVVSDRTIRARISEGARSVEAIGEACGAGTGCGGCQEQLAELIKECRQGTNARSACRDGCAVPALQLASSAL